MKLNEKCFIVSLMKSLPLKIIDIRRDMPDTTNKRLGIEMCHSPVGKYFCYEMMIHINTTIKITPSLIMKEHIII